MQTLGRRAHLAIGAAVLLVAFVSAGCAGRGQVAGPGAVSMPAPQATEPVVTAVTAALTEPTEPAASAALTSTPTPLTTTAASPVSTPDFTAIDSLIKDIKDELGADASAGTDEGSNP